MDDPSPETTGVREIKVIKQPRPQIAPTVGDPTGAIKPVKPPRPQGPAPNKGS